MIKQLNPLYLQQETIDQIKETFTQSSPHLLHLPHVFTMQFYEQLLKETQTSQGAHKRIANKYAYTEINAPKESSHIHSKEFLSWLSGITSKKITRVSLSTKQFSHRDYTLIHDSETVGERLEFFILTMKTWDNRWGGHTVYVSQEQQPIVFPLEGNSLSIIHKEKDRHKFIQYLNHYAGKEKITIIEGIID